MAIPLIAMVGLIGYVVTTAVVNAISVDRAPNLVNAVGIPAARFGVYVQTERAAAVVYLFQPTAANLQAYEAAVAATDKAKPAFTAAMNSEATTSTENASGTKAINTIVAGLSKLPTLRNAVKARVLSPLDALNFYSEGLSGEVKLFLVQTESVVITDQLPQAIGLIATVQAREELSQEHALLAGMLAGKRMTQRDRAAFAQMAATRQADTAYFDYILSPANLAIYNAALAKSGPMQQNLAGIEQAVMAGTPVTKLPITLDQWQTQAGDLLQDEYNGGVAIADAILVGDHQISQSAWVRVAVTGGIGLLGLLLTIVVTTLVARSIIRRLGGLERNALQLAEVQLPDVVGRLRRGENVDVNAEAPSLRIGGDEIGRVGQAFDLVRQTAIRAAVEEARLRQGLNDVFRSLARRSQSLLHRQLTLLDQMERRATDPEALDDLFRLDHLTTRMRRHAEGLVILAGAPPGRAWSSPVRMVDVMRGAIAEVEDYARVSVATRSQAALAGSAVADVIHLLAELIENATTLSPPYTSVRVSGDTVANGFAIEVEDRGLGMSPPRLAELNERLASPPEFNPSDSEQLGLFVVSQLAKRHGVKVTLKASPYGGTAAIVLIPRHLVVTEEAFRAGLPGEPAMAQLTANGNHAAPGELARPGEFADGPPGLAQTSGIRISGPLRRSQGIIPEPADRGGHALPISGPISGPAPGAANGAGAAGPGDLPRRHHDRPGSPAGAGQAANGAGEFPDAGAASAFDVFMPRRHAESADGTPVSADAGPAATGPGPAPTGPSAPYPGNGSYIASPPFPPSGSSPYPAPGSGPSGSPSGTGASPFPGAGSTPFPGAGSPSYPGAGSPSYPGAGSPSYPGAGSPSYPGAGSQSYPGAGPAPYPDQPAPFPGWTLHNTPGAADYRADGRTAPGPGTPARPATPMTPVASPRPGQDARPPWELSRDSGPLPAVPGGPEPNAAEPGGNGDIKGLPRRVKQASLAPQLRADPPQRRTTVASTGPAGAAQGPSPAEIRQTMSALQRGWQQGRSQRTTDPVAGGPPRGPATVPGPADTGSPGPAGPGTTPTAAPDSSASGAIHDSTPDKEAREGSDGS